MPKKPKSKKFYLRNADRIKAAKTRKAAKHNAKKRAEAKALKLFRAKAIGVVPKIDHRFKKVDEATAKRIAEALRKPSKSEYIPVKTDRRLKTPEEKAATLAAYRKRHNEERRAARLKGLTEEQRTAWLAGKAARQEAKLALSARVAKDLAEQADPQKRKEEQSLKHQKKCEERLAASHEVWLAWRKDHVKTCKDIEGMCCTGCHAEDYFTLDDMGENVTYLCCAKRVSAGTVTNQGHDSYNSHEVTFAAEPLHDKKEVARLPKGLLKTYVMGLMAREA